MNRGHLLRTHKGKKIGKNEKRKEKTENCV